MKTSDFKARRVQKQPERNRNVSNLARKDINLNLLDIHYCQPKNQSLGKRKKYVLFLHLRGAFLGTIRG